MTVVGSGQSAAEVVADLLDHAPATRVTWFTRGAGFLPMEYSKLGLEHFSPEYAAHFHGLPAGRRDALRAGQDLLYKGISASTSERIYDALYRRSIGGAEPDVAYAARCELREVAADADAARCVSSCTTSTPARRSRYETDVLVLGTGYDAAQPPVPGLAELAELDEHGRPVIEADRRVRLRDGSASTLFVQGADLHSHGVGAPDLGLGAHRNAVIVNALCGREVYAVRERNVFQTFGVPGSAELLCAEPSEAACRPRGVGSAGRMSVPHAELVDALTRERWERVNRELVAKLLTELAFEDVIAPVVQRAPRRPPRVRARARRAARPALRGPPPAARRLARGAGDDRARRSTARTSRCPTRPTSSRSGLPPSAPTRPPPRASSARSR